MNRLPPVPGRGDERCPKTAARDAGEIRYAGSGRYLFRRDAVELNGQHRHEESAHRNAIDQQRHGQIPEAGISGRSEEHTSELQSLMRISYAVFCLKKKKRRKQKTQNDK